MTDNITLTLGKDSYSLIIKSFIYDLEEHYKHNILSFTTEIPIFRNIEIESLRCKLAGNDYYLIKEEKDVGHFISSDTLFEELELWIKNIVGEDKERLFMKYFLEKNDISLAYFSMPVGMSLRCCEEIWCDLFLSFQVYLLDKIDAGRLSFIPLSIERYME
jgi:hypothetical protein